MAAETWMGSADAIKHGFADLIVDNVKVAAMIREPQRFRNCPRELLPRRAAVRNYLANRKG
jgi:hypothetical protein